MMRRWQLLVLAMFHTDTSLAAAAASNNPIQSRLSFRRATPGDIPRCLAIEEASYPSDEAATLESLTMRQEQANPYFQCAILNGDKDIEDEEDNIIGFICSTRCHEFEEESMSTHEPDGPFLAIHSVVIKEEYRRKGFATAMLQNYVQTIEHEVKNAESSSAAPIQSILLLAKAHLLGFYVQNGFRVNRLSPIVHGQDFWFELERPLVPSTIPKPPGHSWFCKAEQFQKPFPEVKPHLQAHTEWVKDLRSQGLCITSGYRVDREGKPGGGGLLFVAAANYEDALNIVLQDPLVKNDCVDWQLNGWISQVGDLQLK